MNKKSFTFLCFFFLLVGSFSDFTFAQAGSNEEMSPFLDQVSQKVRENFVPEAFLATVVTIDGWDNWNLGTDYAEPHMSLNPNDPTKIFNAYNINGAHYTQNGFDWSNITPNFGTSMAGDPVSAYDSLGNLYYQNMYGSISGCMVLKSTNNGQTWNTALVGISGNDKNWIACDQTSGPYANYVYQVMTPGRFTRSTNNGGTYTQTATFGTQTLPGMMVAVGPDGNTQGGSVYVVTHSGSNGAGIYTFYRSTNGGLNFTQMGTPRQFSNYIGTEVSGRSTVQGMRTRPYPMIAADNSYGPNRGRLYLVYASNTPSGSGNRSDIFCRYSTDFGANWSSPVVVNDDPNTTQNYQFFPAIWCDKVTGRLSVKFYDTRLCVTAADDSMDVFATYSDDGGVTFAPNVRLTNKTFKIKIAGTGAGPYYQGDYDAMMTYNNLGGITYTDFRNMGFGSYFAYYPDFGMTVSPATDSVANVADSVFYTVNVPSVKHFTQESQFTAEITPTPPSGTLTISAVGSNTLSSYPGSVTFRVLSSGMVTNGTYTITFTGKGSAGIPFHKRTATLIVHDPIPVELTAFNASVNENNVMLNWETATETNNSGFEIQRAYSNGDSKSEYQVLSFVKGNGTTTERNLYSYYDEDVNTPGTYLYRLRQIDFDGGYEFSNEVEVAIDKPLTYNLSQNYPNPFNPVTSIKYSIPSNGFVTLKVYDILGNEVSTLVNEVKDAGSYELEFNASSLTSGVYFYTIQSGNFTATKKLMLLK